MTDIVTRLENPPFGTETSERNLMQAAADEIKQIRIDLKSETDNVEIFRVGFEELDGETQRTAAVLRTIADIAEGNKTVNSLPNIAKIAREELAKNIAIASK